MPPLDPTLRKTLEKRIVEARDASEEAARAAIQALAVHEREPYSSLTEDEKRLRRALRAKARQLGTRPETDLDPLVEECAYEQWHRMLFARFLAENSLLMHPDYEGVSVTLEECAELAPRGGRRRTPGRPPPATPRACCPASSGRTTRCSRCGSSRRGGGRWSGCWRRYRRPTFTSDDGLGWVYQFWQTKAKKEVNAARAQDRGRTTSPPSPSSSPRTTW